MELEILEKMIAWGKENPFFAPIVILIASFIDSFIVVGIIINGILLMAVSLIFYINDIVSLKIIVIFAFLGAVIGDQSGYLLGRIFGLSMNGYISEKRSKKAKEFIEKWGILGVFAGRFFVYTRSLIPFTCSTMNMPYKEFTCANIFACIVWTLWWSFVLWCFAAGNNFLGLEIPIL